MEIHRFINTVFDLSIWNVQVQKLAVCVCSDLVRLCLRCCPRSTLSVSVALEVTSLHIQC